MKKIGSLFLCLFTYAIVLAQPNHEVLPLIPKPKSLIIGKDSFMLSQKTVLIGDKNSFELNYLKACIQSYYGLDLAIASSKKDASSFISLFLNHRSDSILTSDEHYALEIKQESIFINAPSTKGIFYGLQTLIQLFPLDPKSTFQLPCLSIVDAPTYSWRGMHLDVCRHFFSKDYIKRYIDYLAMYKMNTFHWHLTEDQGWRIEIKKYPKLTEVGAWRKGSMLGHYSEQRVDTIRYGGFYTQEEIVEIVKYAADRHIKVVPEIELPGHSLAALAAYPEYACTGGPFEVAKTWGVFDDVYCPKEQTFKFIEDVLTEVMDLFPSPYIHIGGDECPKTRWKTCRNCQARLVEEGLQDEHELQSYFIKRIEKFVNSKGRKIIGWDEILEGGLAPNAAVMSWRGTQGGIEAAKQKHNVVMSPGSHCYFDHYQGNPKTEPIAIGGYTPLEKVYSYNPTPDALTKDEAKYILGAQGNVWTEYINEPKNVDYMAMPRMAALSEVVWGTADSKHYKDFQLRVIKHFDLLDRRGINYSKAFFEVTSKIAPEPSKKGILLRLLTPLDSGKIRYALNEETLSISSNPYTSALLIEKDTRLKAAYFSDGLQKSATFNQGFTVSKSFGKPIELTPPPHPNYSTGGSFTLVDGIHGDKTKFGRDWLGFMGQNVVATIYFGSMTTIEEVKVSTMQNLGSWIYYPKQIKFWTSVDGFYYNLGGTLDSNTIQLSQGQLTFKSIKSEARYLRIEVSPIGIIPVGHPGAGSQGWLFLDEIQAH